MALLIGDLLSIDNIDLYELDVVILSTSFSMSLTPKYKLNDIKKITFKLKKLNKKVCLNVDKIIEEDELKKLYLFLEKTLPLDIDYYIFSDLSCYLFFEEKDMLSKLIYNPKTLISSFNEASYYKNITVCLSNELSLDEIISCSKAKNGCLMSFGNHQMFYSRRDLLKNYRKFSKINKSLSNRVLYLEEEKRDNLFPIYEGNNGFVMYTDYIYAIYDELLMIKDDLKMIKLNGDLLKEEEYLKVINAYRGLLDGKTNNYWDLEKIFSNLSRGFLDGKSFLLKGECDE